MSGNQVDDQPAKLKIVHVIGGGEFGGAEQHIIQLLTLMSEHDVAGKVICFYEAGLSSELRKRGIEVKVLQFGRFDLRLLFALRKELNRAQPDLIHTHGVKANFFTRLAMRKNKHIPLITTIHSLLRFDYINRFAYLSASLMERWTRRYNDHYIAISKAIKQSLLTEGVGDDMVSVVHHGIDFDRYSQGQAVLRAELSLSDDTYVIGVVTRLVKNKGVAYMIGAMPRILDKYPQTHLVIVGTGPEEVSLSNLINKLDLQEQVTLVGFRDDVANCLSSFDCFVSASLSEGLGLNILEAMAASLPVVATEVGGVLDFMQDRSNGLLVKASSSDALAEAIMELINNRELAQHLAQEAQSQVEQYFSPGRMAKETVSIYRAIIDQKKSQHELVKRRTV